MTDKIMKSTVQFMLKEPLEHLWVFCLKKGKLINSKDLTIDSTDSRCSIYISDLIEFVKECKSKEFFICHNHPDSISFPSIEDVNLTEKIYRLTNEVGLKMLDHLIISDSSCFSFKKTNLLKALAINCANEKQQNA